MFAAVKKAAERVDSLFHPFCRVRLFTVMPAAIQEMYFYLNG